MCGEGRSSLMCFNGSKVGNWISQGNGLCANINKGIGVVSLCSSCCLLLCCPNLFCGSLVSFDIVLPGSCYLQLHGGSTSFKASHATFNCT